MTLIIQRHLSCDSMISDQCRHSFGVDVHWHNHKQLRAAARKNGWVCYSNMDFCEPCAKLKKARRVGNTHAKRFEFTKDTTSRHSEG